MTQTEDILNKLFLDFKKRIKDLKINQKIAAEQLGVTRSHLNKVINRRTPPSLKLIQKIEEFCYNS